MANNPSNKEKTIFNELQQMPSDIWSLDNLVIYCKYNNSVIVPYANILDDYRDYFEMNDFIEEIPLDKKYWYSPTMFAEDFYGTPDLDFLVLYFAKKTSLFEFNTDKIKVLKPERLIDINKIIVANKDKVKESKNNPSTYLYN